MSKSPVRTRLDPRRQAMQTALILQAETMFADGGVEGVSLRQIGSAIGSANTNVVSYYFGGKDELIEAIFRHRLPALEARRVELLAEAGAAGLDKDIVTLLDVLWRPIFEQMDAQGRHSYAAFMSAVSRSDYRTGYSLFDNSMSVSLDLFARIARVIPRSAAKLTTHRLHACSALIADVLQRIDQTRRRDQKGAIALYEDALLMMASALAAPGKTSKKPPKK